MANTPELYNAALAGGYGAAQGRWLTNTDSETYLPYRDAIIALATAIDTALGAVSAVTTADASIMQALVMGVINDRFPVSTDEAAYTEIANAIAAAWGEARGGQEPGGASPILVSVDLDVPETVSGFVRVSAGSIAAFRLPIIGVQAFWPQGASVPIALGIIDAYITNPITGATTVRFLADNFLAATVTVNLIGWAGSV